MNQAAKYPLLWPAILAGVSPILAAQDEAVLKTRAVSPTAGAAFSRAGVCYYDDANNFISVYGQDGGQLSGVEKNMATEATPPSITGTSCSAGNVRWQLRDSLGVTVANANSDQQIGFEFGTVNVTGMPLAAVSVLAPFGSEVAPKRS